MNKDVKYIYEATYLDDFEIGNVELVAHSFLNDSSYNQIKIMKRMEVTFRIMLFLLLKMVQVIRGKR